jgi:hypothetical protein
MPSIVKGSALAVGDVIQDQAKTGDTHPFVVVLVQTHTLHLHNCTSFQNTDLELIKVVKTDKTGDGNWSDKDSYVVKGEARGGLELARTMVHYEPSATKTVDVPEVVQKWVMGPYGPCVANFYTGALVTVPLMEPKHSDVTYRKIGTIKPTRMTEIVKEIGH